jgi:hypothetical protein
MKLPFEFGTKLVFRLVFPGLVLATATMPLVDAIPRAFGLSIKPEYLLPCAAVAFGWLVVVCDMRIYMLFEGRRYWPKAIRDFFVARESRRLLILSAVPSSPDRRKYLEAGVEIGQYPINDGGVPYAAHPTRLGNIVEGFETYPLVKYGLDSVFYWYRLWVVLDKDLREEIDTAQAVVDSTVYLSFVFYLSGFLALVYGLGESLAQSHWYITHSLLVITLNYLPQPIVAFCVAAVLLAVGRTVYGLSLPAHAQFGELFKSIFDQYRSKLSFDDVVQYISDVTGDPCLVIRPVRERNQIVWRYLRWHRARDFQTSRNLTIEQWTARRAGTAQTPRFRDTPQ